MACLSDLPESTFPRKFLGLEILERDLVALPTVRNNSIVRYVSSDKLGQSQVVHIEKPHGAFDRLRLERGP